MRRVCAWLAAMLWILGFEIAPNVHLGWHDQLAPHTHGGVAVRDDHDHDHAVDHDHHDDHDHDVDHHDVDHHDVDHHDVDHHDEVDHDHHDEVDHDHGDSVDSGPYEPEFTGSHVAAPDSHPAAADDARLAGATRAVASRIEPNHGDHDLLHRGIAVTSPPAAMPTIADAPVYVLARLHPRTEHPYVRVLERPRARGPPMTTVCCAVDCTA